MTGPFDALEGALDEIKKKGLQRSLRTVESMQEPVVRINGREVILMCSNNYLGLANHPALVAAALDAVQKYGVAAGASRLVSGNMSAHAQLEQDTARFKKTESALLFNSGYQANTGIITALADRDTAILSDELNHASIIDGIRLSGARVSVYKHRDLNMVEDLLRSLPDKPDRGKRPARLIITDSVFSMDGEIAPLQDLAGLAEKYHALVMIDEAHATGVLGKNGGGAAEMLGLGGRIHIQMGTFSKALGSFGAYAAGSSLLTDFLMNTARSFIFTTALPPAVCAVSSKAIELVQQHPELRQTLGENVRFLRDGLRGMGFDVSRDPTPIIPLIIGDAGKTMQLSSLLLERGVFVSGIRPPSVPEGTSRLRLTVMATHTTQMLTQVLDALKDACSIAG